MRKQTGYIHYSNPHTCPKAGAAWELLKRGPATGLDISRVSGRMSPNSLISEIRKWCEISNEPLTISDAVFSHTTESGGKVYIYKLIPNELYQQKLQQAVFTWDGPLSRFA
jgi:hypothetical protein